MSPSENLKVVEDVLRSAALKIAFPPQPYTQENTIQHSIKDSGRTHYLVHSLSASFQ